MTACDGALAGVLQRDRELLAGLHVGRPQLVESQDVGDDLARVGLRSDLLGELPERLAGRDADVRRRSVGDRPRVWPATASPPPSPRKSGDRDERRGGEGREDGTTAAREAQARRADAASPSR